jgi:hypothetical protein
MAQPSPAVLLRTPHPCLQHWRGVRQTKMKGRIKVGFRVRVKLPDRSMLEVGTYRSASLAARVYDRALIAMHGRKVTAASRRPACSLRRCCCFPGMLPETRIRGSGLWGSCSALSLTRPAVPCWLLPQAAAALGLNFPLETYQKQRERQRYGPDLNAFLLQLRCAFRLLLGRAPLRCVSAACSWLHVGLPALLPGVVNAGRPKTRKMRKTWRRGRRRLRREAAPQRKSGTSCKPWRVQT